MHTQIYKNKRDKKYETVVQFPLKLEKEKARDCEEYIHCTVTRERWMREKNIFKFLKYKQDRK